MKKKWEEIGLQLTRTDKELTEFIENSGLSALDVKKIQKFIKAWNDLKKLSNDFDKFITPVDALEPQISFHSETFQAMWKRWKDYLTEQHGVIMRSRSEVSALEHLDKISGNDDEKAIEYLRYAMTNRYKNFFPIEEKDIKQPAKGEISGSAFD